MQRRRSKPGNGSGASIADAGYRAYLGAIMTMPPNNPPRISPRPEPVRQRDGLSRLLGGAPGPVLLRFVLLSVVVGMALVFFGLTPETFFRSLRDAFEDVFGVGIDALRNIGKYFLYGAMIVAPLWLISRLLSRR